MPDSFAAALAALQADLPTIKRTTRGQVGTRNYRYAAYDKILTEVRPHLAKHGFVWNCRPTMIPFPDGYRFVLVYQLTHIETGTARGGDYPLTEGPAQQQGSQISYAKRYCLVAVLDLIVEGEDDDGMATRTRTKVTGAEHERLRNGTVEPTPDDRPAQRSRSVDNSGDDPWQDQPPGQFDIGQPEDRPGSIDSRQLRDIGIAFTKAGITDRAVRLGIVADMIGRQVLSSKQLSSAEAVYVIKHIGERVSDADA